jgi:carbamoyl-phosphate synthase small subunit
MFKTPATLALEDGRLFDGVAIGAHAASGGEIVFHTASCGYQEILTDPSYTRQIVIMAFPMIGNYGFSPRENESPGPAVAGFIVHAADPALDAYLQEHGIPGIAGIDTRALVRHIRSRGAMRAAIVASPDGATALEMARTAAPMAGADLVSIVPTRRATVNPNGRVPIALLDCGAKQGIVEALARRDCRIEIFPADTPADAILKVKPAGLLLSNGPGDPSALPGIVAEIKQLVGKLPIFGICLGHQLLARAAGAATYKLPFGHRGANHPVLDLRDRSIVITSQNHGFAVDEKTLPSHVIPTERNLYDGTNEGIELMDAPAFSVQYHPEARPGPLESATRFDRFMRMVKS